MTRLLPALLLTLLTARAAQAAPDAHGLLRLSSAPCANGNGADLRCNHTAVQRLPRPLSYFEAHERVVMRDMIKFNHSYTLEYMRERDLLQLYGPTAGSFGSASVGAGIFGAVVLGAAHLPGGARVLFDRRVHLGPALFDGGGMGAGVGARL